ncbi:phosphatase PAP2 family protein [Paenarthrobacter sp. DKR-5]|uniref:phosphatase PAP2 family protein n=1 Tax=Paenarthrobacter sp. DKR-5 TaxID=2835535 RepID=UPI001BDDACCC|nr:phosphatase PAP2 family protein [Paenarthrobacter sp. DKR-5]MBT1004010.1 phosphatase PAP2 family protein [Paenarthrobacter sp. DKR-5]
MSVPRLPNPLPALRSWFVLAAGTVLFALSLLLGFVSKSYGAASPDLAVDVELGESRAPVLSAGSLIIHFLIGPPAAVAIIAAVSAWLMWVAREPMKSLAFGSVTAAGWLSSGIGKFTVARLRPPTDAVHALLIETRADSFPSGHTAFAASLSLAVILVLANNRNQRLTAAAAGVLFTGVVALSRVYLGVHYPTDVAGSVFISAGGILIWLFVWNRLLFPRLTRLPRLARLARAGN